VSQASCGVTPRAPAICSQPGAAAQRDADADEPAGVGLAGDDLAEREQLQ
jgi:hypothetical protein